jgi:predicted small lipoprotein YifL
VPELTYSSDLARIAVIGALVATLGLAACGRKGGLDPPPAGAAIAQEPTGPGEAEPDVGPDGRPVAPRGANQRTPIDWLLD